MLNKNHNSKYKQRIKKLFTNYNKTFKFLIGSVIENLQNTHQLFKKSFLFLI